MNSFIAELDRIGVKGRIKPCAVMSRKEERYAVSKIRGQISIKIGIEDKKRCNISAARKRLKTVSQPEEFDSILFNKTM